MKKGKFIVLEGTDGSGKSTQFDLLLKKLKEKKINFKTLNFPRYNQPSSYFVQEYLRGSYGSLKEVSAYRASFFYALDRFAASFELKKWLNQGINVFSDRYVGSNLGHQGAKIMDNDKRKEFYQWIQELEYGILGLPQPNLNIFLHVPGKVAFDLINQRKDKKYLKKKKRDIHEKNVSYLIKAERIFCEVADLYPDSYFKIECYSQGEMLSKKEISEKIWQKISRILKV